MRQAIIGLSIGLLMVNLMAAGFSQSQAPEIRWIAGGLPSIGARYLDVSPDDQWIATVASIWPRGDIIQLWHLPEMRLVKTYIIREVREIVFTPDGSRLAIVVHNNNYYDVKFIDISTGEVMTFISNQRIGGLAFSPDAQLMAITSSNQVFIYRIRDRVLERTLTVEIPGYSVSLSGVAFSHDNQKIAAVGSVYDSGYNSRGGIIALWRADGNLNLYQSSSYRYLGGIKFSPNDQHIILSGNGWASWYMITLHDAQTLRQVRSWDNVRNPRFSPDGSWIAYVTMSHPINSLVLDSIPSGQQHRFSAGNWGLTNPVVFHVIDYDFLSNGDFIVGAEIGSSSRITDITDISLFRRNAQWQRTPLFVGHTGSVNDIAFSPDGSLIASVGEDGVTRIWNAYNGSLVCTLPRFQSQDYWDGSLGHAYGVAFSPSVGSNLLAVAYDRGIRLWQWANQQLLWQQNVPGREVRAVSFSPNGQLLASSDTNGHIRLWDVRTGNLQREISSWGWLYDVKFSPDGNCVIAAEQQFGTLSLYNVQSGELRGRLLGYGGGAYSMAIASPDDCQPLAPPDTPSEPPLMIASGEDKVPQPFANLWLLPPNIPADSNIPIHRRYGPHQGEIRGIAFTGDGQTLVTGSLDGKICFWEVSSGLQRFCYDAEFSVTALAFSPNGRLFAYGRHDGSIVLARNPLWLEGDANGNGTVDDQDLFQILFDLGTAHLRSDLDDSGTVDDADLIAVLMNLGSSDCCQVLIPECPPYNLCVGSQFTFRAQSRQAGGTFHWQVIQSHNEVMPTQGEGSLFSIRAINGSAEPVIIQVTHTLPNGVVCTTNCTIRVVECPAGGEECENWNIQNCPEEPLCPGEDYTFAVPPCELDYGWEVVTDWEVISLGGRLTPEGGQGTLFHASAQQAGMVMVRAKRHWSWYGAFAIRECILSIQEPCDCQVQITNCKERLCVDEEVTLQAQASETGGTFEWQVIQSHNQVTPTSGQGATFTIRAQNASRSSNDVVIRVTYTLNDKRCSAECRLTVNRPNERHTHNWSAEPLLPRPVLEVSREISGGQQISAEYVRACDVLRLRVKVGNKTVEEARDEDSCRNGGCSFPQGKATNRIKIVQWSDGGAGGRFGRLQNGQFVEVSDPNQVTHYKAPFTPQVVQLSVTIDDEAQTEDPCTQTTVQTGDDPQQSSDAVAVTVWDFILSRNDSNWRPKDGERARFTARLLPQQDHRNQPLRGAIRFTLVDDPQQPQWRVSRQPGICINGGSPGDPNAPRDVDLSFYQLDPNRFQQLRWNSVQTRSNENAMTVEVSCWDYGAWGFLEATIEGATFVDGRELPLRARLEECHTQAQQDCSRLNCDSPEATRLSIPLDTDGDHIADHLDRDTGQNGYSGSNNIRDPEQLPNPLHKGDGFSDYEEYRGVIIGNQWQELDKNKPELFVEIEVEQNNFNVTEEKVKNIIRNFEHSDVANIKVYFVSSAETQNGVVDWSSSTDARVIQGGQKRVRIEVKANATYGNFFGYTYPLPGIPSTIDRIEIYLKTIDSRAQDYRNDRDRAFEQLLKVTVIHELGHAVNLIHLNDTPSQLHDETCYMIIDVPPNNRNVLFNLTRFCDRHKQQIKLR